MTDWTTTPPTGATALALVVSALLVLGLLVAVVRERRSTAAALRRAAEERAALLARLEELERARPAAGPSGAGTEEFVITDVGDGERADAAPVVVGERIEGRLFADLVLRETVVKAASWAHGLRRALAPETRDRARLTMRRETRRSARRRRADTKEALRQYYARERGDVA